MELCQNDQNSAVGVYYPPPPEKQSPVILHALIVHRNLNLGFCKGKLFTWGLWQHHFLLLCLCTFAYNLNHA